MRSFAIESVRLICIYVRICTQVNNRKTSSFLCFVGCNSGSFDLLFQSLVHCHYNVLMYVMLIGPQVFRNDKN
jgi:hypothetical protein